MQQAMFGKQPGGERLLQIQKSPNYKNSSFQNLSHTPTLAPGANYYILLKEFFFMKKERHVPLSKIPSIKTDLLNLDSKKDVLVWFGHSSYFMQIDGKKFLVDPVFCGHASPFSFSINIGSFKSLYTERKRGCVSAKNGVN